MGKGHSRAQCDGGIGAGWRVDTLTPTFQAPRIVLGQGLYRKAPSFPREVASGLCKYFHRGKSSSSQGFLSLEAKPRHCKECLENQLPIDCLKLITLEKL